MEYRNSRVAILNMQEDVINVKSPLWRRWFVDARVQMAVLYGLKSLGLNRTREVGG